MLFSVQVPTMPSRENASTNMNGAETLPEARELRKSYRRCGSTFSNESEGSRFTAVDDVSLAVKRGETFAIKMSPFWDRKTERETVGKEDNQIIEPRRIWSREATGKSGSRAAALQMAR